MREASGSKSLRGFQDVVQAAEGHFTFESTMTESEISDQDEEANDEGSEISDQDGEAEGDSCDEKATLNPALTTVMICNIACRVTTEELALTLDNLGMAGTYRFVYVPISNKSTSKARASNLGYGFVDFKEPQHVERCRRLLDGQRLGGKDTLKRVKVSLAHHQKTLPSVRGRRQAESQVLWRDDPCWDVRSDAAASAEIAGRAIVQQQPMQGDRVNQMEQSQPSEAWTSNGSAQGQEEPHHPPPEHHVPQTRLSILHQHRHPQQQEQRQQRERQRQRQQQQQQQQ
eukprot:CAMPEP_0115656984 /NCGR_PEP_ID=MMETSP0272-20121206/44447_1 /TAXON_ID=71861 /ORGANISM="Scrippsiella trochoidea, Strain CCMP3099" /LENGTH=285 /DNA_ID=CAMNT_0003094999 /DNA_START=63 /DNA_END=917 /DNA_ORIENTATION=+